MQPTAEPPLTPLLRRIYRAPITLFRAGLAGWIRHVAAEWILVTTRGRRTGRPHAVLVDLLWRDPEAGIFYVQSAYGARSDWVRNVEADPNVRVRFRGRDLEARARVLGRDEAARVVERYVRTHPVYSRAIARFLGYRGALAPAEPLRDWLAETFLTFALATEDAADPGPASAGGPAERGGA